MLRRLLDSEGRWIHALLVLSTITVALILVELVASYLSYFSDVLLMLFMAWLFAFILSPVVGHPAAARAVPAAHGGGRRSSTAACSWSCRPIVLVVARTLATSISGFITRHAGAPGPGHARRWPAGSGRSTDRRRGRT